MSDAAGPPRGRRAALSALLLVFFASVAFQCFSAAPYQGIFRQLEMKALPAPTEALLSFAAFVRTPLGLAVWSLAGLALAAVASRGAFDRFLNAGIVLSVAATAAAWGLFTLALRLPIWKIQDALSR